MNVRKIIHMRTLILLVAFLSFGIKGILAQEDIFNFIWAQDFEETPVGQYSESDWKRDWNNPSWSNGLEKTYIVDVYGDHAMKFNYPTGCVGPSAGGGQWWAPLGPGHDEVYFSYNMMFRPGFDWVKGGKLPGLGGIDNPTGGKEVAWDGGFSARIMFAERKEWETNYPEGKCFLYVYHQDKTATYGDCFHFGEVYFPVTDSVWYNMTIRCVLNTVSSSGGDKNGILEFFLNGKHIMSRTGLRFRNISSVWIDTQHIVSFFGGCCEEYGAHRDEWILFDDFYVFTYKEGVDVVRGRNATPSGTTLTLPANKGGTIPKPTVVFVDQAPPTVPVNLSTTFISGSFVGIKWDPSTDNTAVEGYRVFLDGEEYGTVKQSEAIIGGLEPHTEYTINVSAYDERMNESALSEPFVVQTVDPDTEPPTAPENVRGIDSTYNSLAIQWSPATDNIAVSGYDLYLNGEFIGTSVITTYSFIGLEPSTEYSITISAVDYSLNTSPLTEPILLRTKAPDLIPPTIPEELRGIDSTYKSITVQWDSSTDNIAVTGYEIFLDGALVGITSNTSYSFIGLDPSTTYAISVSALDDFGNRSLRTQPVYLRTKAPDTEPPTTPDGLTTTMITQNSIGVVWNSSTDNDRVSGYHINVNDIRKGQSITNSYTISGLLPGIEYTIAVSAYDEAFNESGQAEIKIKTKNPDASSSPSLPSIKIDTLVSISGRSQTISMIGSYGYTQLLDYGLTISSDKEFQTDEQILYAERGTSKINPGNRVKQGLQVLYEFNEEDGNIVHNRAANGVEADLRIHDPLQVTWLPGRGLKIIGNTVIASSDVPSELLDSISRTNEITLEAWVRPQEINQSGPARLISISRDNYNRLAMLGHEGNSAIFNYVARLTTSNSDDENGYPQVSTTQDYIGLSLHHIVYTRHSSGEEKIYVNGIEKYTGTRTGDISSSDDEFYLSLANELSGERLWLGTFYLAAIYNKAFSEADAKQNFDAGLGKISFTTNFELEPNIPYILVPFVRTDQGIVNGEPEPYTVGNVLFSSEEDSLYMSLFPNPSNGDFRVRVQCALKDTDPSFIRISDFTGTIIYNDILDFTGLCGDINYPDLFSEESYDISDNGIIEFDLHLSPILNEGIYSVMLVVGNRSIARRLVIM